MQSMLRYFLSVFLGSAGFSPHIEGDSSGLSEGMAMPKPAQPVINRLLVPLNAPCSPQTTRIYPAGLLTSVLTSVEVEYQSTLADGAERIKMEGDTSYCATLSGKPWPDGLSEVVSTYLFLFYQYFTSPRCFFLIKSFVFWRCVPTLGLKPAQPVKAKLANFLSLFFLLVLLSNCQVKRYLPSNEYLLKGASLDLIAADSVNTTKLREQAVESISQRISPRWRVWWYYREHAPLRWLGKKIGREPAFYQDHQSQQMLSILQNRATNQGHFFSLAFYTTDTLEQQKAIRVNYQLQVGEAYVIDTIRYAIRDSSVATIVDSLRTKSLLKKGGRYSLSQLKLELQRLENGLRQQGYYYFAAQDLEFLGDTIGNDHGVKLLLKLKDGLGARHLEAQRLHQIRIYSNYKRSDQQAGLADTTFYEGLQIICKNCPIRPNIMAEAVAQRPGMLYNPHAHEQTIERLANYNTFQYISLNYEPVEGQDSLLNLLIYLSPQLPRSISGEVGAAYNSGRYFGPEFGFKYANRNLRKGAELFTVEGDVTYNFFLGPTNESRIPRSGIFSLKTGVEIPRFWLPQRERLLPTFLKSSTSIQLGFKMENIRLQLNRFATEIEDNNFQQLGMLLAADANATSAVRLWQLSGEYAYSWRRKPKIFNTLTVLRLRYQNPEVATEELLSLSRSLGFTQGLSGLGRLDRMILWGPTYRWTYDTRLRRKTTKYSPHNFFANLELGLVFNKVLPVGSNERSLVAENSNYLQPEADLRYYFDLNSTITLAARAHLGIAAPFGGRAIVPYFDLYTVGGPNSLRGFRPRGLGPGTTPPLDNNLLGQNGYGNVLFESSLELRYQLAPMFQLAAFADAGNVWLYKTEAEPTPGDFSTQRFAQELAVDAGVGVRIDFSFLVIRIDVAKPVSIPYETSSETPPNRKPRFVLAFGQAF